jgi:hypothetical protein
MREATVSRCLCIAPDIYLDPTVRQQRLEIIRALGLIAYRHLRDEEIFGIINVGCEKTRVTVLDEDGLWAEPFRSPTPPTDYAQIQFCFHGREVSDPLEPRRQLQDSSFSSRVSGRAC